MISTGLIADPDLPAEIAEDLADELPELLADQIDAETRWVVSVRHELLPLRERPEALIKTIGERREKEGWGLAICLTDPRS